MTREEFQIGDGRFRIGGVEGRGLVHTTLLAEFVKRHWTECETWKREELLGWIRWFQLRGLAFWHCDELGKVDALIMGRPVLNIRLAENRYHYTTGASVWWVDLLIAECGIRNAESAARFAEILRGFYRQARLRLGTPAAIGWERATRRRTGRTWPERTVSRRIESGARALLAN